MTQMTIDQSMQFALMRHQAGHLAEAEGVYRQVLSQHPNHAGALHLLGVIAHQSGRDETAVDLIRRAIMHRSDDAQAHNNLGTSLHALGRLGEATEAYRVAVRLDPELALAHNNLGTALRDQGRFDDSIAACRNAIRLKTDYAEAYNNLGNSLMSVGALDEAVAAYRNALELKPGYVLACNNLGNALKDQGRLREAVELYRRAIHFNPDYAEAYSNLGNVLTELKEFAEAADTCRRALELKPVFAEACNNLGNALRGQGKLDDSVSAFRQAITIKPDCFAAHLNLAKAFYDQCKLDDAISAFQNAIALKPDDSEAHWNLAVVLLLGGNFSQGWAEYEWRWKWKQFKSFGRRFSQPQWNGEELHGKTILLYAEQGWGDAIHFVRYASMVEARGATVVMECQPELHRLLEKFPGISQVLAFGQPLPPFDFQCPLMSLPLVFGTRLDSIPHSVPYLNADSKSAQVWATRMFDAEPCMKVGLAWAGRSTHMNDENRSLTLGQLFPLTAARRVRFHSLQKGPAGAQIANQPQAFEVTDFSDKLFDFAETAALIANLDLIITVDTAVAHLAGAMGKPVWLMLPFIPDWRWLLDREDSPWYPTMRLFRQKEIGQWDEVISRVAGCLAELSQRAERGALGRLE
jgi:tetratricopeptide (TPR) repeat protein